MTANEARELTNRNKRTKDDIYNSIEAMAKAGYNYAAIELIKILDHEKLKTEFEEEGYTVTITDYFRISW